MSIANIDIILNSNPQDGDKFQYTIVDNGNPVTYSSGKTTTEKTFRDLSPTVLDSSGNFNNNGQLKDVFGRFRDRSNAANIKQVLHITRPGGNRIVWVGEFDRYEYVTTSQNLNVIFPHQVLITDEDRQPIYWVEADMLVSQNGDVEVNAIEYIPSTDTVVIGGNWDFLTEYTPQTDIATGTVNKLRCLAGIKLSNNTIDFDFSAPLEINAMTSGKVNSLFVRGNILYVGGTFQKNTINPFTGVQSNQFALTAIRTNVPSTTYGWNYNFDVGLSVSEGTGNPDVRVIKFYRTTPNGISFIIIGGKFNAISGTQVGNIGIISVDGTLAGQVECGFNNTVNDIDSVSGEFFIVGEFTQYTLSPSTGITLGATQNVRGVVKTNNNIRPIISFNNTEHPVDAIYNTVKIVDRFSSNRTIWLGGMGQDTPDETNLMVLNNNGTINTFIMVDSTVNSIEINPDNTKGVYVAGEFTNLFPANNPILGANDIEIGNTVQDTLANLGVNLLQFNNTSNIGYIVSAPAVTPQVINVVYNNNSFNLLSVIDVVETLPRVEIVIKFEQLELDLKDFVRFAYKRSDYIVKSAEGTFSDWNNVDFNYTLFSGNIEDYLTQSFRNINKKRLNFSQLSQYLNLTPLNRLEEFNVNQFKIDEVVPSNIYTVVPARIGKWLYTAIQNKLNNNLTEQEFDIAYLTRGWRNDRESDFPKDSILIEGRKRDIIKGGVVKLPFIVDKIGQVRRFNSGFANSVSIINNTNNSDEYVSYIQSRRSTDSSLRFELVERGGTDFTNVTYNYIEPNCNYDLVEVIFINRYGFPETTYMNGRINTNLTTKEDSYTRSIRDINGNLTSSNHSKVTFNKRGTEDLLCNTGLVREYNNPMYEDLTMSDRIWVVINGETIPATVKDTSFTPQTRLVEKTINYEFRFELDNTKNKNLI